MGSAEMARAAGLIRPILAAEKSLNQRWPSGPTVIAPGPELAVGVENSVMAWVEGLISPILPTPFSVNQRLPSGPAVIHSGPALEVGTGNSVMVGDSRQRSSS